MKCGKHGRAKCATCRAIADGHLIEAAERLHHGRRGWLIPIFNLLNHALRTPSARRTPADQRGRSGMEVKPDITPRCDCGQVTEWYWDNDPEIYPPGQGEWIPRNCWHCTAVLIMKWDRTAAKMGLTPDGGLLPAKVDRFVELITKQSTFPKVLITTREWPES